MSKLCLLVLSTKLKRTWLKEYAEKSPIDRNKNTVQVQFYTFFWLFFFFNTAGELYDECSELTSPLNDSIMRKLFCMNLCSSLSIQINKSCTS